MGSIILIAFKVIYYHNVTGLLRTSPIEQIILGLCVASSSWIMQSLPSSLSVTKL